MFTLNVKANVQPTVDYLNRLQAGLGDKCINSAINATAAKAKTQMIRGICAEYAIDRATVAGKMVLYNSKRTGRLQFTATLIGNPHGRVKRSMNVVHFIDAKTTIKVWKKKGQRGGPELMAKIKRSGGAKIIEKGAFVANNGRTVFRRLGPGHNAKIDPVQTIGVPQMFNSVRIQRPVIAMIQREFPRIFGEKFKYFTASIK